MTHTRARIGVAVCAALIVLASTRATQAAKSKVLFVQHDKIVKFDAFTGLGAQPDTVSGRIRGVSIVNFHFDVVNFPDFTFNNRAGITS